MMRAAALGLAEFIAVIQDGLQRSYDFIEDVAEGEREGRPQGVLLTISEVTLSIPVEWSMRLAAVDLRRIETKDRATTAYELERLLLNMPMADPEIRKTIREQAYSAISRQRFGEPPSFAPEASENKRTGAGTSEPGESRTEKALPGTPPTLDIRFSEEAKDFVKRVYGRGEERQPEIALSVLGEESLRAGGGATGRLEIRFKPVLA